MRLKNGLPLLASLLLPVPAFAVAPSPDQSQVAVTTTEMKGPLPAETAHITQFAVGKLPGGAPEDTGDLHIFYSDKTEVVYALPPRVQAKGDEFVENVLGFGEAKVAEDGRTIGWLEDHNYDAGTALLPLVLDIYGSGKTVLHFTQGQVVTFWEFQGGGKQAVAVWTTAHGLSEDDYQLYDTVTGKLLGEAYSDIQTQSLAPDAPDWAKQAEKDCHRCGG